MSETGTLVDRLAAFERATIEAELDRHQRNVTNAARALGLERAISTRSAVSWALCFARMRRSFLKTEKVREQMAGRFEGKVVVVGRRHGRAGPGGQSRVPREGRQGGGDLSQRG